MLSLFLSPSSRALYSVLRERDGYIAPPSLRPTTNRDVPAHPLIRSELHRLRERERERDLLICEVPPTFSLDMLFGFLLSFAIAFDIQFSHCIPLTPVLENRYVVISLLQYISSAMISRFYILYIL